MKKPQSKRDEVLEWIKSQGGSASNGELRDKFGGYVTNTLNALEREGHLRRLPWTPPREKLSVQSPEWQAAWSAARWAVELTDVSKKEDPQ